MRHFNTAGPCIPELHFMLPPEPRLPEARSLIDADKYFVVHAPRQTGKTTTLAALARDLTAQGGRIALRFSCESAEVAGDDFGLAERLVLEAVRRAAADAGLKSELMPPIPWPDAVPGSRLSEALSTWASKCPVPIVLFFDEIDALRGESLRSVLRQLRDRYTARPAAFPASVVLCGLRDVRDPLGTSSAFSVKVKSLRIGDFTLYQVADLYRQHTMETGQEFTTEAVDRAFTYTQGQPWLTNAIAHEIINEMGVTGTITSAYVEVAKERLILARATHLDSLVARLEESRVRRVIEPLLAGTLPGVDSTFNADMSYVRDLGLIAQDSPLRVANPICREVIARVLGDYINARILADPRHFLMIDGRIDMVMLLERFAEFWRENGEFLASRASYQDAAPQLIMMAFINRIVNGSGYIDREYGIGAGRIDLLLRKPYTALDGSHSVQKEALEIKLWRDAGRDPIRDGLSQLDDYLERFDLPTGILAIFDTRRSAPPMDRRICLSTEMTPTGREVVLFRG